MAVRFLLALFLPLLACHAATSDTAVERWGVFQLNLTATVPSGINPFEVELTARFSPSNLAKPMSVTGFYDGEGQFRVRFSPPIEGDWTFKTASSLAALDGHTGTVHVTAPGPDNHGPVVSQGFGLEYADGTPHFSVGTTSYQWASKDFAMQEQTLDTLRTGPFNKMRMTVFPKWYVYNHANPIETGTAYEVKPGSMADNATAWGCNHAGCPSVAGSFDLRRFNVSFWQNYEKLIERMGALNVVADIIVFHPYDNGHWGFDCMGGRDPNSYNTTNDEYYLRYLAARLSAYRNVWWAMANEWSFCHCKSFGINESSLQSPSPIWDQLFETLSGADPYKRQMSIHNGNLLYNHSRPWISHVSLQGLEDKTPQIRTTYGKPVIWDEVQYEGDIPCCSWGALSGQEMADRFWFGASLGVYVGHSETVTHPGLAVDSDEQPLWWAKGGTLIGQSPPRIQAMRTFWSEKQPMLQQSLAKVFGSLKPAQESLDHNAGSPPVNVLSDPSGRFYFLHFNRPGKWTMPLSSGRIDDGAEWCTYTIDYWDVASGGVPGTTKSCLPKGAPNATFEVQGIPYNVLLAQA